MEEDYWHARARANELKDGDKNTSYFHHKASSRRRRNTIKGLEDDAGCWVTDPGQVEAIITNYFENILTSIRQRHRKERFED